MKYSSSLCTDRKLMARAPSLVASSWKEKVHFQADDLRKSMIVTEKIHFLYTTFLHFVKTERTKGSQPFRPGWACEEYRRNIPGKYSVVAWGPSRYAPEASARIPMFVANLLNFLRRRQDASAPVPSPEKSVPWFQADSMGRLAMGALGIYGEPFFLQPWSHP
jgi:hypothetical protein